MSWRVGDARHRRVLPLDGLRSCRLLPCGAGPDVPVHVLGAVYQAGLPDFLFRGERVGNERPALFDERRVRLDRLDHPRMRRLGGGFGQRRDPILEAFGELQRRRGHVRFPQGAINVIPCAMTVKRLTRTGAARRSWIARAGDRAKGKT